MWHNVRRECRIALLWICCCLCCGTSFTMSILSSCPQVPVRHPVSVHTLSWWWFLLPSSTDLTFTLTPNSLSDLFPRLSFFVGSLQSSDHTVFSKLSVVLNLTCNNESMFLFKLAWYVLYDHVSSHNSSCEKQNTQTFPRWCPSYHVLPCPLPSFLPPLLLSF